MEDRELLDELYIRIRQLKKLKRTVHKHQVKGDALRIIEELGNYTEKYGYNDETDRLKNWTYQLIGL